MRLLRCLLPILLLLWSAAMLPAAGFELNFASIGGPLRVLTDADQQAVADAIGLIRKGQHAAALIRLTPLAESHPDNSSLRILTAYTKLQIGNLLGAFDDAEKAEAAKNGNHYKCLFFAKVALVTNDLEACRRELRHAEGDPSLKQEVAAVRKQLESKEKQTRTP